MIPKSRRRVGIAATLLLCGLTAACATSPPGTVPNPHPLAASPGPADTAMATGPSAPLRLGAMTGTVPPLPPSPVAAPRPPDLAVVPVLPGTQVTVAFDVRAVDTRPSHAARLGKVTQDRLPAEGEVIERGVVTVTLDRHGRGVGSWSNCQPFHYLGRVDPPSGRYHPMTVDIGLRVVASVQPSPDPGHRWLRVVAILDDLTETNEDPQAGTARPTVRSEQWQADLDLRDASPVRYPFFVRPDHRTEIRLETATVHIPGASVAVR